MTHTITNPAAVPGTKTEIRRNLALNPNAHPAGANSFISNSGAAYAVTRETVSKSAHPQGILARAKCQRVPGSSINPDVVLSMYSPDGLSNTGPARHVGMWVYVSAAGYQVRIGVSPYQPLAVGTWTWIVASIAVNTHCIVVVRTINGSAVPDSVVAYVTGVTAVVGTPPSATFSGDTQTTAEDISYAWTGAANASASVEQRQQWLTPPRTRPLAVAGYAADFEARNIVHDLLDGTIGVSFVAPRPRSGTLTTVYRDRAAAFEAAEMYRTGDVFTYLSDELAQIGMSFVLNDRLTISQDTEEVDTWYVDIGYQEVTT